MTGPEQETAVCADPFSDSQNVRPMWSREDVLLKVGEMIKLLESDGWYLVRVRGSHRHYRHPGKPGTATVAGKPSDTLPPGD